jgi:hypothetical protein
MLVGEDEFQSLGFVREKVETRRLNIDHPDPMNRGPFCRLRVTASVPLVPGVYAWCVDDLVCYVGKAGQLRQIVQGMRMGRAYNDYTYVPPSKLNQLSNPRVRVNGLINSELCKGNIVSWWWAETQTEASAGRLEARLIRDWDPPWNRARPAVVT